MITQKEYMARRRILASKLAPGSLALIPAAKEVLRNGDAHYSFRQDSDFYYLTGFNEPEALLCIFAEDCGKSYLFNRPFDPIQEQWTGKRLGQNNADEVLGVDAAFSITNLAEQLPELLANKTQIYCSIGRYPDFEQQLLTSVTNLKQQVRRGINAPESLQDLEPLLSEMRLIKSSDEIRLLRRAAELSIAAHKRAMRACRGLTYEYELEAEFRYELLRHGCRQVAYESIVGSGANSCILHYNDNNQRLKNGDLVLMDAGGEFANYASDITRTFPINGRFSLEQRAIYELVLQAQRAGIACVKPGIAWDKIQEHMVAILTRGLCELGLLKGSLQQLIDNEAYKSFYMHTSGHWLGLDVHDCGRYKLAGQWRILQPGMVFTVEPGIYITAGMKGVDKRWWNIGVRIEDDIVVTSDGYENLTETLPADVEAIEALLHGH